MNKAGVSKLHLASLHHPRHRSVLRPDMPVRLNLHLLVCPLRAVVYRWPYLQGGP